MKKKKILMMLAITFSLAGCGNGANKEVGIAVETKEMEKGELATQEASNLNLAELSADELLDLFIEGELTANYNSTDREPFYITDLPIDVVDDWYSFSIGDRVDLDNDGEKELILNGPYGGMFLDARDGQIFVLAEGDGTIATLSYTWFDGQTWIVHSDTTHGGRETYDFILYDGTGQVVDTCRLMKEYWDTPNEPDGPSTVYTYRNKAITREEYEALFEKFFHSSEEESVRNARGYFFSPGTESAIYTGSLWDMWDTSEETGEIELRVEKVQSFEDGDLYRLEIVYDKEMMDRFGTDRTQLGLFLVMEDRIYKAWETGESNYTVEQLISTGALVCSSESVEDSLGKEERGWHESIVTADGKSTYRAYNNLVETGYYERFVWEQGKGLVEYYSGYGAEAEAIELYLKQ